MKKLIAFFRNLFDFCRHSDDFIAADMARHDRILHDPPST